jgi:putative ABC transport system permease protein
MMAELGRDIRDHIERETQDNIERGMSPEEARRAALLKFGNVALVKEDTRAVWTTLWLEQLWQDVRYGLRQLLRNPSFAALAIITLALGIAANTTIFSAVSLVLLKKPAVRNPDGVMVVFSNNTKKGYDGLLLSAPDFEAFKRENNVFEGMAAADGANLTLTGHGAPEELNGARVTTNYFQLLGLSPAMGRSFSADEGEAGRNHVVILSHGLWEQHFAGNPNVIASHVGINGEPCTVIGVMPPGTDSPVMQARLWTPLVFSARDLANRGNRSLLAFARLKPHMTTGQANAEIGAIASRMAQRHPKTERDYSAGVLALQEYMIKAASVETSLAMLMGAVAFVLLIACANIAGLLLARAAWRRKEIALRAALGAGRLRVVRQLLTESLLVAVGGGGLGVLLGFWGIAYLHTTLNWNSYVAYLGRNLHMDGRTLFFSVGLTLGATLLFGLVPALQVSKSDLVGTLKEGGRAGTEGSKQGRLRSFLVAGEIALSVVLLAGAGFLIQGFVQMIMQNPGFHSTHVVTARIVLSSKRYRGDPARQAEFFESVVRRVRDLPGVESASATQEKPLEGNWGRPVKIEGRHEAPMAGIYYVGADYFRTMGIPLIRGRGFSRMDKAGTASVAIVSRAFARRYFSSGNAIGGRIAVKTRHPSWAEIVGVVGNVKEWPGERGYLPQVYEPFLQQPMASMAVVARTHYDASAFAPLLRRAVWSVDKDQPIKSIMTMGQVADQAGVGGIYFMAGLMGAFAALALVLAGVGIYGVIAYSVAQRRHEIGIRIAVGAQRSDVLGLVLKQGALLAIIGCGIGLALAVPLPRLVATMFGPFSGSPLVLTGVGLAVAIVSLLATYIPARRAMRVDPAVALRNE